MNTLLKNDDFLNILVHMHKFYSSMDALHNNLPKCQKKSNIDAFDSHLFDDCFLFDDSDDYEQTIDEYYNQYLIDEKPPVAIQDNEKSQIISDLNTNINLTPQNETNIFYKNHDQSTKQPPDFANSEIKRSDEKSLNDFIQYLSFKLTKDKKTKISKEVLLFLYKHLQQFIKMKSLTRDDKREKKKIYTILFKCSSQIILCFEMNPQIYLLPVILFINHKQNQKKRTIQRVDYLKKLLHLSD